MDKVGKVTLKNTEHPWAIQAAMSFWSVSKEQDALTASPDLSHTMKSPTIQHSTVIFVEDFCF